MRRGAFAKTAVHYNRAPIGAGARLACGLSPSTITAMSRIPSDVTCKSCRRATGLRWLSRRGSQLHPQSNA